MKKRTIHFRIFFSIILPVAAMALLLSLSRCNSRGGDNVVRFKRFFSDSSFWNQPLPDNPEIDPHSD